MLKGLTLFQSKLVEFNLIGSEHKSTNIPLYMYVVVFLLIIYRFWYSVKIFGEIMQDF